MEEPSQFSGAKQHRVYLQSFAIRWALGCVNSPLAQRGPGGEITQPRARLITNLCNLFHHGDTTYRAVWRSENFTAMCWKKDVWLGREKGGRDLEFPSNSLYISSLSICALRYIASRFGNLLLGRPSLHIMRVKPTGQDFCTKGREN